MKLTGFSCLCRTHHEAEEAHRCEDVPGDDKLAVRSHRQKVEFMNAECGRRRVVETLLPPEC